MKYKLKIDLPKKKRKKSPDLRLITRYIIRWCRKKATNEEKALFADWLFDNHFLWGSY